MNTHSLNRKERRAQRLLAHYARCEALGRLLGCPNPDGKHISVALFKLEKAAHQAAEACCNGDSFRPMLKGWDGKAVFEFGDENAWGNFVNQVVKTELRILFPEPAGFFVNGDPRGYALKIDPEQTTPEILALGLEKDWGGYLLLSPEINGDL